MVKLVTCPECTLDIPLVHNVCALAKPREHTLVTSVPTTIDLLDVTLHEDKNSLFSPSAVPMA